MKMLEFDFSSGKLISRSSDTSFNDNFLAQMSLSDIIAGIQIKTKFLSYGPYQNEFFMAGLIAVMPDGGEDFADHGVIVKSFLRNSEIWEASESATEENIVTSALTVRLFSISDATSSVKPLDVDFDNHEFDLESLHSKVVAISDLDAPADAYLEINAKPLLRDDIELFAGVDRPLDYTVWTTYEDMFEDDWSSGSVRFVEFELDDDPFDITVTETESGVNFHTYDTSELELGENEVEAVIEDEHGMTSEVTIEIT